MAEIGKLEVVFDVDTRKVSAGLHDLQSRLARAISQIQGFSGTTNQASTALIGMSTSMGLVAGAAVLAASAIGGVVVGLGKLITSSAEAGGELFDLSQKTGIAVETLSGLSIAAKTTGSDIKSIVGSLVIFQKNMEAAGDSTSKQGKLFQSLNIDIHDNEKALREVFTALGKMEAGAHQTALATQFFGRSGAALLAIIKETNGNLDAAIKKYGDLGLLISGEAAAASDKFNDTLEQTQLQLMGLTRTIGLELLPIATDTLAKISASLAENKDQWKAWGQAIATWIDNATHNIGVFLSFMSKAKAAIEAVMDATRDLIVLEAQRRGIQLRPAGGFARPTEPEGEFAIAGGVGAHTVGAGIEPLRPAITGVTATGGAGKGRGGGGAGKSERLRLAELELAGVIANLESEEGEVKRSLDRKLIEFEEYFSETIALENKRHEVTVANIQRETASTKDKVKLKELENKLFAENVRHAKEEFRLEDELIKKKKERAAAIKLLAEQTDHLADIMRTMERSLFGPQSTATQALEKFIKTVELPSDEPLKKQVELRDRIRDEMEDLGEDITRVFSKSIEAGFEQGAKRGLVSLAQGLLNVVEQVFLKRLAEGLGNILSNAALGGGGGFWGGLLKAIGLGAVSGAAGASLGTLAGGFYSRGISSGPLSTSTVPLTSGLIHRASGGPVSAGMPYLVGERGPEMFMPGQSGNISPNAGMTININVPVKSAGSYSSPKSRRELAQSVAQALQGAIS